jgi:hypothetical protein
MRRVPQLQEETGISADYLNEYFPKCITLELRGINKVAELVRVSPIKKYRERFPENVYDNVVNGENERRVSRLDEIAEDVNKRMIDTSRFSEKDFKRMINEVVSLVNGEEHARRYEEV